MPRPALRFSWPGTLVAGTFLLFILAILAWVVFIASKNPADSGESAIILIFFGYPWLSWLPVEWVSFPAWVFTVLLNSAILYLVFGGLRMVGRQPSGKSGSAG